jgi:hypothetical protein
MTLNTIFSVVITKHLLKVHTLWNTFCLAAERGQCAKLSPHKDRVGGGNKGIPPHSDDNI